MAYDLYVVTDDRPTRNIPLAELVRQAIEGGADIVQYRDKTSTRTVILETAIELRKVTHEFGIPLVINDRLDIAIACMADGLHLGQNDLPVAEVKKRSDFSGIIGVSVGSPEEAARAEAEGADYVAISPLFSTPTKTDAGPGHGLAVLQEIRARVSVPVIAIGGIGRENVSVVIAHGADGVAVISAVFGKDDVRSAARELKSMITAAKSRNP
jgi:thiamine-phosphate pyrophosphorylase